MSIRTVETLITPGSSFGEHARKAKRLEGYLSGTTASKELQGMFFWGHGGQLEWQVAPAPSWDLLKVFEKKDREWAYVLTDSSKKKAPRNRKSVTYNIRKGSGGVITPDLSDYASLYQDLKPAYRLGICILWACGTTAAQNYPIFAKGTNSVFAGSQGILVPHGFHLFGKPVSELIPSGKQGTK